MEFWRYYRIIRKRRWLILLGIIVCVGAVSFSNYKTKPEYTGRTTVMESMGMSREGVPLFPQQNMQLDLQLRLSNLGNIATSYQVLSGAAQTLDSLGLHYSAEEILSHTKVQPVRDTNILAVEVTLPRAEDALVAADVIASEFKRVYSELNNSSVAQSREFIEAQVDTTRETMLRAQDALKKFKEENEIVQLDQQSVAAIQRMSQAKVDLNSATVGYEAARARRGKLDIELEAIPKWEVTSTQTARDPVWQRLREQLVNLESQRASWQSRRGPNHPDMQDIDQQIGDVRTKLQDVTSEYVAATNESKNPIYSSTLDRWVAAKVDEVGAEAQCQAVQTVLNNMHSELSVLPDKEAKLTELKVNLKAATDTYGLMKSKLEEAKITEQQVQNEVSLRTIDKPYVFPVNQRKPLKLILALLLSPILGIGVAFMLHYTDNTVKTAQEAERLLGMPVLAVVPGAKAHALARQNCPEILGVAYQMLTSNLWIASQNQGVNSVAMVSAEPDAGRSVTASNLAVSLAREGARVVLVDADLRKPTQHLIFGVDNKVGLTNILSGGGTLEDVLVPTKVQGLLLVPSGPVPDNPVKLLRSSEMAEFADQIKEVADFVIYDTPAGVTFPDPVLVGAQVGGALVVHSAGRVPRGSERELHSRLESVGVHLLGAVLNKVKKENSSGYFHYCRSYEGYDTEQLAGKKAISGKSL